MPVRKVASPPLTTGSFPAPVSIRPKQLAGCSVAIFTHDTDWGHTIQSVLGRTKETSLHSNGRQPTTDDQVRGKDVAFILFYKDHEMEVRQLVRQLREASPGVHIAIVTGNPAVVPSDLADIVIGKAQHTLEGAANFSQWFLGKVAAMLEK